MSSWRREDPEVPDSQLPKGDPNVEHAFVGALIVSPAFLPEVIPIINPDGLTDPQAKLVYRAICDLHKEGKRIDVVTISHRLASSMEDPLVKLGEWTAEVPAIAGCIDYAKTIAHVAAKRMIATELITYNRKLQTSHDGLDDAADVARRIIQALPDEQANTPITAATLLERELERAEERRRSPDTTSGIRALDDLVDFFEPGAYTIIAGRPSQGKSTFMRQLIRLNADKVACLVYSLEDEPMVCYDGMACSEAGVNSRSFWDAKTGADEDQRVFDAREALSKKMLYFYPKFLVTASLIRAHVEPLKAKHERLAVFIDYVQQMEHSEGGNKGRETKAEQISATSRILKLTALEFKIPMILLAQCNRNADHRSEQRPEMADLKDCGQLEADADNIVFLYSNKPTEPWRRVKVAKRRHGQRKELKAVTFLQHLGRFEAMPDDQMPAYDSEQEATVTTGGTSRRRRSQAPTETPEEKPAEKPGKELWREAANDDVGF